MGEAGEGPLAQGYQLLQSEIVSARDQLANSAPGSSDAAFWQGEIGQLRQQQGEVLRKETAIARSSGEHSRFSRFCCCTCHCSIRRRQPVRVHSGSIWREWGPSLAAVDPVFLAARMSLSQPCSANAVHAMHPLQ